MGGDRRLRFAGGTARVNLSAATLRGSDPQGFGLRPDACPPHFSTNMGPNHGEESARDFGRRLRDVTKRFHIIILLVPITCHIKKS